MSDENNQAQDAGAAVGAAKPSSTEVQPLEDKPTQPSNGATPRKTRSDTIQDAVNSEDAPGEDEDSEAETLIQSPEKKRNIVDTAPPLHPPRANAATATITGAHKNEVQSRKRKRSVNENHASVGSPTHSHRSSPLSSPVAHAHSDDSASEHSSSKKAPNVERGKTRRNEGPEPAADSDDKMDTTGGRKGPTSDPSTSQSHRRDRRSIDTGERRETRSATYPRHSDNERSPSPQATSKREHKRGASTQLTTHDVERKRRGRPPLISTQRHRSMERARSSDSDRSDSPAPQRSSLNKLTGVEHDTMSPVKSGPKKRRDKNGRTAVARHANSGNLEMVKVELAEHHEDLNLADNAGNTPLQIAALEGHIDIVEFLLSQGCDVETRNIDKDTPLIDAVENGHVEVVKLLLDHGANPRVGNAKGDEPYELVPDDDENYEEIRRLLAEAKERLSNRHRAQDTGEVGARDGNSSRAASAASPRDSPPVGPRSPPAFSSRRRTGRSESTRNDLLWQAHNQPTLTKLAGKGDVQGVANILNILQKAETESLIAAAKAGHEEVLQHLLAMGDPDPDPAPVKSLPPGFNTPLLAAIGRGHVDVVKLLISQSGFDPTRKLYGRYYFELARERKGADWQQEYTTLKSAYDRYTANKGRKQVSPRKTRDADKFKLRGVRRSPSPASTKRLSSSPNMTHRTLATKSNESSPREIRKGLESSEKRKVSGSKLDNTDSSVAVVSDLEHTAAAPKKGHRSRRSQSDVSAQQGMDHEAPYRRRRLVTGKEHRRNKSSAPGSGSENGEVTHDIIEVKHEDKVAPKLKRTRSSMSPEPKSADETGKVRLVVKKRRTVESSPEEGRNPPRKFSSPPTSIRKSSNASDRQSGRKDDGQLIEIAVAEVSTANNTGLSTQPRDGEGKGPEPDKRVATTSDPDILPDADQNESSSNIQGNATDPDTTQNAKAGDPLNTDTEMIGESTGSVLVSEESLVKVEEKDNKDVQDEEKAAAAAAAEEESVKQAKEQQARREAQQREEEEAKQIRKKLEEAQAQKKAEEEAAAKRREEEERQELKRRELEQRRRQQDYEMERRRLAKLPATLSKTATLVNNNDPLAKAEHWLREKFLPLFTVTTQQLDSQCGESIAQEQWVPNYQVAGLLATKDLNLRAYTSIEKRPASAHERSRLWGVSRIQLSFDYLMNWGLGITQDESLQRERENREKFMSMDEVFWVKLLDFHDQVPRYPHLTSIKLYTKPISLKTWQDVLEEAPQTVSSGMKTKLANGIHNTDAAVRRTVE